MPRNLRSRCWPRATAAVLAATVAVVLLTIVRGITPPLAASGPPRPTLQRRTLKATELARIRATEPERTEAALRFAQQHFASRPVVVGVNDAFTDYVGHTHVRLTLTMNEIAGAPNVPVRDAALMAHVATDETITLDAFDPARLPETLPPPRVSADIVRGLVTREGERLLSLELILRPRDLVLDDTVSRSTIASFQLVYEARTVGTEDLRQLEKVTIVDPNLGRILSRRPAAIVERAHRPPSSITARRKRAASTRPPRGQSFARRGKSPSSLSSTVPFGDPSMELGEGFGYYNDHVTLTTTRNGDLFELCHPVLGLSPGTCVYAGSDADDAPAHNHYRGLDNVWGDGQRLDEAGDPLSVTGETSAVDLLWGVTWTWDLLQILGSERGPRFDGKGIEIEVHAYPDADVGLCVPFATRKSIHFPGSCAGAEPWESVDIVGHELSHVDYLSRAAHAKVTEDERGATIETTAEIMGELAEFYMRGFDVTRPGLVPDVGGDFIYGGDIADRSQGRRLFKPSLHGGLDYVPANVPPGGLRGDPYDLGGPLGRAFFFMSRGAVPYVAGDPNAEMYGSPLVPEGFVGLGNDTAARIWHHAVFYFGNGWFIDVRDACRMSAFLLYGHEMIEPVMKAFDATGIRPRPERGPPAITLAAQQLEHERKVVVDVSVDDEHGIRIARLRNPVGDPIRLEQGNRRLEFTVGPGPRELATGTHVFTVDAIDHTGNAASKSVSVEVEAGAPTTTIRDTTSGRTLTRVFEATATDPAGVHRVELRVDQQYAATSYAPPFRFTLNFRDGPYASGQHLIEATAFDRWGNRGRATTTITTDRSMDSCVIRAVGRFPTEALAHVESVDTSGGTVLFEALYDGVAAWSRETAVTPPSYQAREDVRTPLAHGQHRLELKCTDRWGNVRWATPFSFRLSAQPTISFTARSELDDILVDYSAADDTGLARLEFSVDPRVVWDTAWTDSRRTATGTLRFPDQSDGSHRVCGVIIDVDEQPNSLCRDVVTARPTPTPAVPTPRPPVYHDEVEPNYNNGYAGWQANNVGANVTVIRGSFQNQNDRNDAFYLPLNRNQTIRIYGVDGGNSCRGTVNIDHLNVDNVPQSVDDEWIYDTRSGSASYNGGPNDHIVVEVESPQACLPYRYELFIER